MEAWISRMTEPAQQIRVYDDQIFACMCDLAQTNKKPDAPQHMSFSYFRDNHKLYHAHQVVVDQVQEYTKNHECASLTVSIKGVSFNQPRLSSSSEEDEE